MTAPNTIVAPTASAPASGSVDHGSPHGISDALDAMTQEAIAATLGNTEIPATGTEGLTVTPPKPDATAAEPVTREDGATWNETAKRWKNADGSFAEGSSPVVEAAPAGEAAEGDDAPIELPEGMVAVPSIEGRELATKFRVLDHEGELDVPDLTIEFTANGKVRNEPLDKVVRLAERGVYNEEREQQVVQSKQEALAVQQHNTQLVAYVKKLHAEQQRILSSDDAYLEARAQYEQANTPQAILERERAERAESERMQAFERAAQVSNHYFENSVVPAVTILTERLPTVTADEIGARLVILTNHLRIQTPDGDTMIPPSKINDVNQIIAREIVPWAQSLHEERDRTTSTARQEQERRQKAAEDAAERARIAAQKAKSLLGQRGTRGKAGSNAAGNSGNASTRQTPQQKPITSIDDAMASVVSDALAAVAQGG